MSNTLVPQKLPPDHLAFVQTSIAAGDGVAGDDLLLAIEQSVRKPLSEAVRKIVSLAIIPAVKTPKRGRPPKFGVLLDLALDKVDQRYPALLRYEKRKKKRLPDCLMRLRLSIMTSFLPLIDRRACGTAASAPRAFSQG